MDLKVNIFENIRTIIIEAAKSFGINDKKILDKITAEPPKSPRKAIHL